MLNNQLRSLNNIEPCFAFAYICFPWAGVTLLSDQHDQIKIYSFFSHAAIYSTDLLEAIPNGN